MFLEHERGGNHDRAELVERGGDEPELVVAPQDDHDHVSAADALAFQEVGRLVGPALHVGEREDVLFAFGVAPYHGAAVGIVFGYVVDDIVAEVERIGAGDREGFKLIEVVVRFGNVAEVDVSHKTIFLSSKRH